MNVDSNKNQREIEKRRNNKRKRRRRRHPAASGDVAQTSITRAAERDHRR